MSHPARGAWIEIRFAGSLQRNTRSHPARGAWIEITRAAIHFTKLGSHPARGAWIEMIYTQGFNKIDAVAPREGCVN